MSRGKDIWIINLRKSSSSKDYGSEIYINNKRYANAVKTDNDLSKYYEDTINNYSVEFRNVNSTESECVLNDSLPVRLNLIQIKHIRRNLN